MVSGEEERAPGGAPWEPRGGDVMHLGKEVGSVDFSVMHT